MNKVVSQKLIIILLIAIFSICGCSEEWWEHPGGVIAKNQLPEYVVEYLSENNILKNEDLLVMYDVTVSLDNSELGILTTQNFIYHKKGTGDTRVPYGDIKEVKIEDVALGTGITIITNSGLISQLEIAALNNVELFIDTLELKVNNNLIRDLR